MPKPPHDIKPVNSVSFDVRVLDGTAVVQLLPVTGVRTFEGYAAEIFNPHVIKQQETAKRVDELWSGTPTLSTASKSQPERNEAKV